MAKTKSKKVLDDEDDTPQRKDRDDADEAEVEAEEATDDVEVDAEEATDDVEVDAEEEEIPQKKAGDDDAGEDEDGDDDDDEDSIDEGPPPPPKPKLTWTTTILIGLNWVAAMVFLWLAATDYFTQLQYAHRAMLNYTMIWGLPLEEETDASSLSLETRPRMRLTSEQLNEAFKSRRTGATGREQFAQIEEEVVPVRIRPSDMSSVILTDIFRDVPGGPQNVNTLEAEIKRLQTALPAEIEKKAKTAVASAKTEADKRALIRKSVFTMAWSVQQVRRLDDKLNGLSGNDLDKFAEESVQRRLYYDILAPINVFRPGDASDFKIEKLATTDTYDFEWLEAGEKEPVAKSEKRDAYSLDDVKKFMQQRLAAAVAAKYDPAVHFGKVFEENKSSKPSQNGGDPADSTMRDSVEKRRVIAFLLMAISQVKTPTHDEKAVPSELLFSAGVARAQAVSGMNEFTGASINYVRALRVLEGRMTDAIVADRQGWVIMHKGKDPTRTNGFIDAYEAEIDRVIKAKEQIDIAEKRLEYVKAQKVQAEKTYEQRAQQHRDILVKLVKARQDTEKYAKELRVLQEQLREALVDLSDAADINFRLEAEIRAIETAYNKKGARK
jgi:hypothetical protein